MVDHPQGFIVDKAIEVTLGLEQCRDLLVPPGRPVVLGEDHLCLVAPHGQGLIQVFGPGQRLADLGATQGVGVMQGMGGIFGRRDGLLLFDVPEHLGWRFRARCHHEFIGQAIDTLFLTRLGDVIRWRNQGHGTGGRGGTKPGPHLPLGIRRQQVAIHVAGAATHGVACHDVFGYGRLHEALGGIDLDLAGLDVLFIDYPFDAAIVVDVAVGVDHGLDRFVAAMLVVEIQTNFGCLRRNQGIHYGDAILAFDDGHVGQIEVAHLVNAIRDLKQTTDVDQLRLAPEAGVDAIGCFVPLLDESVFGRIPDHIALFALDHCIW
ncbi:hypothetical protein D3C87_1280100 [compost metagenome]